MKQVKYDSVFSQYFDETTMSIHLKTWVNIIRKKWKPGGWEKETLDTVPDEVFMEKLIETLQQQIEDSKDGFVEISNTYSKVFQLWPYRIVLTLPPLSNTIEITAVKPVKKLTLSDYELSKETKELLENQAQWILISGAPGEWKTTFAQALIEQLVEKEKVIKTIESPRDLMVPDDVTQYSFSYAPHDEIRDILLLSRPDYTVYDEVRNKSDFELFKDLRLTGIGLIGIIHATKAIDSIQRFLGTISIGVIPQVIDTVVYIKWWQINQILQLNQTVKVPEGMWSQDLARPLIQVNDFYSEKVLYEIYSYGEQIMVTPMSQIEDKKPSQQDQMDQYALEYLQKYFNDRYNFSCIVKRENKDTIKLFIPKRQKGGIIWKKGRNINKLEKQLGINISVRTIEDDLPSDQS